MITKTQLKEKADSNNLVKHSFEMPWDETSLSRIYDRIDASVEGGALIDIVSAKPIEFHPERLTLSVEVVMDITDMLEEQPDEEEEA